MSLRAWVVSIVMCAVAACATTEDSSETSQAATTPDSVEVTPATAKLPVETQQPLVATGVFSDGTHRSVTSTSAWTTTDAAVATVSAAGVVTALHPGTATITATAPGGAHASATLTVSTATLVSLAMSPATATVAAGLTTPLLAVGKFSDGTRVRMAPAAVTWGTGSPAVATVSATGLVTGVAAGSATITATHATGAAASGSAAITVSPAKLEAIAVRPATVTLPIGLALPLTTSRSRRSGPARTRASRPSRTPSRRRASSRRSRPGTTLVTATDARTGLAGAAPLKVNAAAVEALVIPAGSGLTTGTPNDGQYAVGETVGFDAVAERSDGTAFHLAETLDWATSNAAVATVSNTAGSKGLVVFEGVGDVTLTAHDPASNTTGAVTLHAKLHAQLGVTLSPAPLRLPLGYGDQLVAFASFDDRNVYNVTGQVTYATDDASVAIVDAHGFVTSVGVGGTHLTVSGPAPGISARVAVQVDPPVFAPPVAHAIGTSPVNVRTADLDGDGHVDLISSDYNAGLHILWGRGDGTFDDGGELAAGSSVSDVALGDLDHDGHLDLVAADYTFGQLSILYGQGGRRFAAAVPYVTPVGKLVAHVVVGDTDNDNTPDLIFGASTGELYVARGHGDRTFAAVDTYPIAGNPFDAPVGVALGDMNNDGRTDLVVANSNSIVVLLGQPGGTFGAPVRTDPIASVPVALALGDFDRDGQLDVAVGYQNASVIGVFFNTGAGTVGRPLFIAAGNASVALAVADLDGDGVLDIASASEDSTLTSDITVALGTAAGAFQVPYSLHVATSMTGVAAADFDEDGRPDLAVCSELDDELYIVRDQLPAGN